MEIQSWMIRSWPPVEWYFPATSGEWPIFSHVGTRVYDQPDAEGRCFGNTVWMGCVNGQTTGAAWEWTEFRVGVLVLSDPNTIISNLQCRSHQGLSDTVALNRIAHALPWQDTVNRVLKSMRDQPLDGPPPARAPSPHGARRQALGARA